MLPPLQELGEAQIYNDAIIQSETSNPAGLQDVDKEYAIGCVNTPYAAKANWQAGFTQPYHSLGAWAILNGDEQQ